MLLPNEGVELVFKHLTSIIDIFHFDFNEKNHYISLSDDGEIIEWIFNIDTVKISEISKFHLKRPNDDLLSQKKHTIRKLEKDEYYKITKEIHFDNFIALGYSDGVILVYQVTKKEYNKNDIKSNKSDLKNDENENKKENEEDVSPDENEEKDNLEEQEDRIESESNLNLNEAEDVDKINSNSENLDEKDNEQKNNLNYYNYYSLYYVLLGNLQEIEGLCYIPQTKMLISSSDDYTVKIYNFETGHLNYYFKLDFIVNRIIFQNISRNKNESKIVLTLLSNDPVKVLINLSTNPISFNNYIFKNNDIIQLEKINDKYYGLNSKNIVLLDKNLEHEGTFISLNNIFFNYFNKFKDDYLIVDNENYIRIVEVKQKQKDKENDSKDKNKKNEKNKKPVKGKKEEEPVFEEKTFENIIITNCKFKVGEDCINGFFYVDNYIFVYCQDGKLYLVKYDKIIENYERIQMEIEDEASLQMMANLVLEKKPKKKGKGKKGKDKKK